MARNKCRFSTDDVALALNHKDQSNRVTDIYISKNWDIIDEVQTAVIKLVNGKAPSTAPADSENVQKMVA